MIACAFPGQGIQKPGMSAMIQNTRAWRLFEEANDILGYDLGKLSLEGPEDQLNNTAHAQVAIFVTCYALWELNKDRYKPRFFLGHSLGEITALGAAGAFSFAQGVTLVKTRGELMAKGQDGGMAAVLGLDLNTIHELCAEASPSGDVQVANENSPAQTVVSGTWDALERLTSLAKDKGAKRVVKLNVSGPFHSKLMEPVAARFAEVVDGLELTTCHTPVLSNDGESILREPSEVKPKLVAQIASPVRFMSSVQKLSKLGIKELIEVSPDNVLISLARRSEANLQFTLVSEGGM